MSLERDEWLDGERIILERKANLMINIKDYGMKKKFTPSSQEAIGGKLYLSNYRLIFKSHPINRVKGTYSILLPTVRSVRDSSGLLMKKIEVNVSGNSFEFVVWGRKELLTKIEELKSNLSDQEKRWLETITSDHGNGLVRFKEMDKIVDMIIKIGKSI
ncbi:GRAM domain-containing protein [Neobacillus niacini]|uniref:GRAM domain-containing protein n=1 Tax=Neobacillus niacini TaxID=86668 RepID=UPI002FFDE645